MPEAHQLLLFIAAGLLLNLTPGPDVAYIVAQSVRGGQRAGLMAAGGIAAGCLVHVTAAALGVSALLLASSQALGLLKAVGALYLLWVGAGLLRSAARARPDASVPVAGASHDPGDNRSLWAIWRRGFLTNVLNPKVALFFLAFVPQFIAPGTVQPGRVFMLLGLIFTINGLLVCCGWALAAAWAARRAGALPMVTRWLDGLAGSVFVLFGLRLALADLSPQS